MSLPCAVQLKKDQKYYWCVCGLSQKKPFCDGAHKGSGMKSLCFTAEASGTRQLCMCRKTKTPPYCDESHQEECSL